MRIILFIFLLMVQFNFGQVTIGTPPATSDTSTLLNVDSSKNGGFLTPRLAYTDTNLQSATNPVTNPTEGLLFYNNNNTVQIPGYYVRSNGMWNLVSSESNKTTDYIAYLKASATAINLVANDNSYTDFNLGSLNPSSPLINNVGASISGNNITLNKGSYIVTLTINVTGDTESATGGILGKATQVHSYMLRCFNTATNAIVSGSTEIKLNQTSQATGKKHMIIAKFSFNLSGTTIVKLQVARNFANSTYTGTLSYKDAFLHIQKAAN